MPEILEKSLKVNGLDESPDLPLLQSEASAEEFGLGTIQIALTRLDERHDNLVNTS